MPAAIKVLLLITLLCTGIASAYEEPTKPAPRPFTYRTDTFAFANETVFNYVNGAVQSDSSKEASRKREYTRRCFVVTRAAVQFWKFARFDPTGKPLSRDQLAARIREVTERSVWEDTLPSKDRIVFPGYSSLHAISAAEPRVFQENIGLGWPVYFRAGNAPIAAPVYRETEARLNDEIFQDLKLDHPTIVWLYNFPSLSINHVVVVISAKKEGHHYRYQVYDPNYTDGPKSLDFDTATRTFTYQPTFYFKGGSVQARAVYRGVLQ